MKLFLRTNTVFFCFFLSLSFFSKNVDIAFIKCNQTLPFLKNNNIIFKSKQLKCKYFCLLKTILHYSTLKLHMKVVFLTFTVMIIMKENALT